MHRLPIAVATNCRTVCGSAPRLSVRYAWRLTHPMTMAFTVAVGLTPLPAHAQSSAMPALSHSR